MSESSPWLAAGAARLAAMATDALRGRRLSILSLHRVLPSPDPLFPEELDHHWFDQLMALMARSFEVLTLGQAARSLRDGTLPPRALVITFDDGYANNAEIALPILQRHGLKASFFVTTGSLNGGRMWNDTVIECLRRTTKESIDLESFGLGRHELRDATQRRSAISAVLPIIKYMTLEERESALLRLQQLAGAPPLPTDLMMRSEQVQLLHRSGMEIGGHTVRHPILCALPEEAAKHEILQGQHELRSLVDAPIDVFAYPNGRPGRDYDHRHVAMLKQAGFLAAVSTAAGCAARGADLYQLPRFTPWDRGAFRFALRLVQARTPRTYDTVRLAA